MRGAPDTPLDPVRKAAFALHEHCRHGLFWSSEAKISRMVALGRV
jgi:hypothetical protein